MNKVLLILDGLQVPGYLMDAAANIGKMANCHIHAIFLNKAPIDPEYNYFFPNDLILVDNPLRGENIAAENSEIISATIQTFKDVSDLAGLSYTIDERNDYSLDELLELTAFSDLLLADAKSNFYEYLLSDLLTDSHCPVLLTKQTLEAPGKLVLAYDGSVSSIYAMRMFTYLFPQWKDVPLQVVYVSDHDITTLPEEKQVIPWLSLHYSTVETKVITGNRVQELANIVNADNGPKVVIMGAYGRKALSRLFHKSLSKAVIDTSNAAAFITHV